jgi:hypothetical protein
MANTVTDIKRIIGRKYSEPVIQREVDTYLNYSISPTENDDIAIDVS